MKSLTVILIFSLISLISCSDNDPAPTLDQQIQGVWQGVEHQENWYGFNDGQAWNAKIVIGQTIYENKYVYSTSGDTLDMLDIEQGTRQRFTVIFRPESTALIRPLGGLSFSIIRVQ